MPAQTVRAVKQRSWGSGTRLAENWSIPAWAYYPGRVAGGLRSHPAMAALGACIVAGMLVTHSLIVGALIGVVVFAFCLTWMVRSEQRTGEAGALGWPETFAAVRRRARLRKQWPLACESGKIVGPRGKGAPALPRKVEITGPSSLKARVNTGTVGVAVKSLQKSVDVLADVLGCHDVIVTPFGPGVADVEFHWADPVGRILPLTNMPLAPKGGLSYGIRPDGRAAFIWHHMSVLVGGLTRHGKSNLIWALLADANRQGLHTRLYVSDPKGGVEMDALEGHVGDSDMGTLEVRHYAKTPTTTLKMIESLEGAMLKRQEVMKDRGQRVHIPTKEDPLVVLVLDETLALIDLLKKGVDSPLGRIAFMGGAVGYVVWANLQVAQVETVGRFRDLVPQRICFATPSAGVTNAVLGDGADALGAKCSRLPKGVGFSYADGDHAPTKYRAAMVEDDETRLIAAGRIPRGMLSKNGQMRALYRWFGTDAQNQEVLLYVGKTNDLMGRTKEHMTGEAPWIGDVTHNRVEWFPDEKSVLDAEKKAIESEHPLYNIIHNAGGRHRFSNVPRTKADAKVAVAQLKATANRARGL